MIKAIINIEIEKVNGLQLSENMPKVNVIKKHIKILLDKLCQEETKFLKKKNIEAEMKVKF